MAAVHAARTQSASVAAQDHRARRHRDGRRGVEARFERLQPAARELVHERVEVRARRGPVREPGDVLDELGDALVDDAPAGLERRLRRVLAEQRAHERALHVVEQGDVVGQRAVVVGELHRRAQIDEHGVARRQRRLRIDGRDRRAPLRRAIAAAHRSLPRQPPLRPGRTAAKRTPAKVRSTTACMNSLFARAIVIVTAIGVPSKR